ncbi:MAG: zinc ribbon domain-containing protein [Cytophagaceae bacterium]
MNMNKVDKYEVCGLPVICQCCGMPLIKDSLKNRLSDNGEDFCSFCFDEGNFTEMEISVQQMQEKVKRIMLERGYSMHVINSSIRRIPYLKRWIERFN